jgi:hypothetical protein
MPVFLKSNQNVFFIQLSLKIYFFIEPTLNYRFHLTSTNPKKFHFLLNLSLS